MTKNEASHNTFSKTQGNSLECYQNYIIIIQGDALLTC